MDSILVADMNRHIFKDYTNKSAAVRQPPPPVLLGPPQQQLQQQFVVGHGGGVHPLTHHPHLQQQQQLGLPVPAGGLEKRPTFDNIDKRSSWSHDPHTTTAATSAQFLNREGQLTTNMPNIICHDYPTRKIFVRKSSCSVDTKYVCFNKYFTNLRSLIVHRKYFDLVRSER